MSAGEPAGPVRALPVTPRCPPDKGTLFLAPPGAGNKKEPLFRKIVSSFPGIDYSPVLYLGPNLFVLSEARSQFYAFLKRSRGCSAYIPFQCSTIRQLAADLHEKYSPTPVISDSLRTLFLCEMLGEQNMGYARILSELLMKIRHYIPGRDLAAVREEIRGLIFEERAAERAVRALDVLISYEGRLRGNKIADPEGVLAEGVSLIAEHMSPPLLIIDGFHDPTALEFMMIGQLINASRNVHALAEEGTEMAGYLMSRGMSFAVVKTEGRSRARTKGFYSYPSMEDEVEGIARNIRKLLSEGTNPWEITLCFPRPETYLPMTKRVFSRYGIPLSIGEYQVTATAPFVALNEMIACIEEDYPRVPFLSLLTSPCFPAVPPILKDHAVSCSYRAGVVQGKRAWLSIRDTLLNSGEISSDEQKRFHEFQEGIVFIVEIIEGLKKMTALTSFLDGLDSALDRLGFFDTRLNERAPVTGGDMTNRIRAAIAELRTFASFHSRDYRYAGAPAFYLRHMLQSVKGSDTSRDGVNVLSFELAPALETKALFFCGMREGDFPSRPEIDPLLPERVKKALGIPDLEYYLSRQRHYFRRLLNLSSFEPWFSCPSADGDKVFLPSPFLDWEEKLPLPDLNIFTKEDALVRDGAFRQVRAEDVLFWGDAMHSSRDALRGLQERAGKVFRGFMSVTDIDYFRKCPLRFYIDRVLLLEVERPPRFEVEARLWGTLAHRTMEYLFRDGDIDLDDLEAEISMGLREGLQRFPLGDFWSGVAEEIFRKLLPAIKEQETALRLLGFRPFVVEETLKAEINGLRLKGKIDRADCRPTVAVRRPSDSVSQEPVILLDYKTGAPDRDSLQMPLYAAMWQETNRGGVEKTGYYLLREGRIDWHPKQATMDAFIQRGLDLAQELAGKIKGGAFGPDPVTPNECRYCVHSPLCDGAK
ncbi:MAG: PD-(D/E)XK nuclease family protein [Nitrospiraceae bacterium]|nr:MAG: PD-(D/E)XK nuclease family protein [Nitrospiraceae bacterium]